MSGYKVCVYCGKKIDDTVWWKNGGYCDECYRKRHVGEEYAKKYRPYVMEGGFYEEGLRDIMHKINELEKEVKRLEGEIKKLQADA